MATQKQIEAERKMMRYYLDEGLIPSEIAPIINVSEWKAAKMARSMGYKYNRSQAALMGARLAKDKSYILEHHLKKSPEDIAKDLGRPMTTIRSLYSKLNISMKAVRIELVNKPIKLRPEWTYTAHARGFI